MTRIWPNPVTFLGYLPWPSKVDNLCPECKFGDVDFGLGGDGRWRITWDFIDCAVARKSGSHLPTNASFAPTATVGALPAHPGKRSLRGQQEVAVPEHDAMLQKPASTNYLEPGYMVTKDGITLIADVYASRQKAEQEAQVFMATAPEGH